MTSNRDREKSVTEVSNPCILLLNLATCELHMSLSQSEAKRTLCVHGECYTVHIEISMADQLPINLSSMSRLFLY